MIRRAAAVVAFTDGALVCPAAASAAPDWLEPVAGTAMIARVRRVAPFQVLEAVVKPPGYRVR